MLHWRSFGRDFKTHLLVLNSSRHRPTTFSNKSGLFNNAGLPSPSRWQRLQPQGVCSVFRSWTGFRHYSGLAEVMLLAAIRNALQRLPTVLLPHSVLSADIQDPNSHAIATQYCNSNLSREMCSNRWLCQDSESICLKSSLLDCFSQGNKRLSTASQAVSNILSGETAFRQDEDNVESFSSSGSVMRLPVSTPGLVQQLLWFIQFFWSVSTGRFIDIITKQSFFRISITRWSIGRLVDKAWDSLCTNDSA